MKEKKKSGIPSNSTIWIPYAGAYEKKLYDIWLMDRSCRIRCYPNAGTFHHMETGEVIDGSDVFKFKLSEEQW